MGDKLYSSSTSFLTLFLTVYFVQGDEFGAYILTHCHVVQYLAGSKRQVASRVVDIVDVT